jgi:hypothetical protein
MNPGKEISQTVAVVQGFAKPGSFPESRLFAIGFKVFLGYKKWAGEKKTHQEEQGTHNDYFRPNVQKNVVSLNQQNHPYEISIRTCSCKPGMIIYKYSRPAASWRVTNETKRIST